MATINNMKGTSYQSFSIGRRGITIYQGLTNTINSGVSGDIFINKTDSSLSLYNGTSWNKVVFESTNLTYIEDLVLSDGYLKTSTTGISISGISDMKTDLGLGTSAYLNSGTASGNIPVLDSNGKLPSTVIPAMALTNVTVVTDEDDKPTSANEGDVVIVTSTNKTYICSSSSDTTPTWTVLEIASSVTSVNALTGNVVLTGGNITSSYSPINFSINSTNLINDYISGIDLKIGDIYNITSNIKTAAYKDTGTASGNIPVLDSNGKLLLSIIPDTATVSIESSSNITYPTSPRVGDVIINTSSRISLIYDGTSWNNIQTQSIISVNGLTGSTTNATDGIITLADTNIDSSYSPINFSLPTTNSVVDKSLNGFLKGIDEKLADATGGNSTYISDTVNSLINKVDTSSSNVEITSNGNIITVFSSTVSTGEKLNISNSSNSVTLSTSGVDNVDLILEPSGTGSVKVGTGSSGSITTDAGIPITIIPGAATSGNGSNITISGGNATGTNSVGGTLILGYGTGTSTSGDIQTVSGFVPSVDNSITNKKYVDSAISDISQLKSVSASQNIEATLESGVLTIVGPDLTEYLTLSGGTLTGQLTGTTASFSGSVFAKTQDQTTNDTSLATTAFVQNHASSYIATSTFANLPASPSLGMMYLVTNGRKPGEVAGSGTGTVCVYDGNIWMDISSAVQVQI